MKAWRYVILLGLLGLLACATMGESQGLKAWEGKRYEQLIAALGAPQQTREDNQGGRILIYASAETMVIPGMSFTQYSVTSPGMATTQIQGSPASVRTKTEQKLFWVNGAGVIYRTAYQEE